jgi:hypothetical protein
MNSETLIPADINRAEEFGRNMVGNIDPKDFMDGRNAFRSPEKLLEDSAKGKKAEIFIYNAFVKNNIEAEIDFGIYEEGIGDDGDIIVLGQTIDVKSSSPRAKCLMVEEKRFNIWEEKGKNPDCLCMVAVDNNVCEYMFGCSYKTFKTHSVLLKRGEYIPNTNVPLKANNYVIQEEKCKTDVIDLIRYIKTEDEKRKSKSLVHTNPNA